LDYTTTILERPGYDREAQLRRLRATCTAAVQCQVPVQVRLAPGAGDVKGEASNKESDATPTSGGVSLSPYLQGVKDLAKVLLEFTELKVHISCWNGTSEHMIKLLQAFPDTLYIGLTAAVGFAKAAVAHECAFDVPLSKLILETDAVIPSPVVMALGRKAFAHSGAVGFCAAAVAQQKKIPPKRLARITSLNTVQLYGLTIRSKQAAEEAAVLEAERVAALAEEEEEEVVAQAIVAQEEDAEAPSQQTKKQKKKKKKKGGQQQQQQSEDADREFDDEHLATLLDEKL
jgi:Tat protein secretion system quality control protein TatD with DNase activity